MSARRLRVLHVHKIAGISGSENHLLQLLPALDRDRFDVSMVMLTVDGRPHAAFADALTERGVRYHCERLRHDLDWSIVGRLARIFRDERADIIHTHLIHADLYGAWAASRARVRGLVSTKHNDDAFRHRRVITALERTLTRRASSVIAISNALRRFLVEVVGLPAAKVKTVHYGYDGGAASPGRADGHTVVSIGRLVEQKGHADLLDAFPAVLRRFPAARLIIVGDGPLHDALRSRAQRLDISARVSFPGYVPAAAELLATAAVYAHPSHWEGFGFVLLEAMAWGRPIVAAAVSAIPEVVVNHETGLLVPCGDVAALSDALVALLADPARAAAMGCAGAARLRSEFSVARMAAATARIYEACVSH